jgi:flagellar biosynthesis/type III secretory pathway protein FliH
MSRIGVTLRFSRDELELIAAVIRKLMGPRTDIRKGMKQIILNVCREAVREITEKQKQKLSEELNARPGDLTEDFSAAQSSVNPDSDALADAQASVANT